MTSPTSEELLELRDRTWGLIYPETWKPGPTLIHKRGKFQARYDRETRQVELWRKNENHIWITKITFRAPPYDNDWEEACSYCITCVECLPQLRELMILDDLADV